MLKSTADCKDNRAAPLLLPRHDVIIELNAPTHESNEV